MLFDGRERVDRGIGRILLSRHRHALPVRGEFRAVVGALNAPVGDLAQRQRRKAMRAAIFHCDDCTVTSAIDREALAQHRARNNGLVFELLRLGDDIPGVADKHGALVNPLNFGRSCSYCEAAALR